jgi:hypothetical protein
MTPPASTWASHYDPHHAASAATVALAAEQCSSVWRGPPDRFGAGRGLNNGMDHKPLDQRRSEGGPTAPEQPHWIMDQIYLLLTSFHVVIEPLAVIRSSCIIRTITQRGRFVCAYTPDTLRLFKKYVPEVFANVNANPICFPLTALHEVIFQLLVAACNGHPACTKTPRNFNWSDFQVSNFEKQIIISESLRGFLAAVPMP